MESLRVPYENHSGRHTGKVDTELLRMPPKGLRIIRCKMRRQWGQWPTANKRRPVNPNGLISSLRRTRYVIPVHLVAKEIQGKLAHVKVPLPKHVRRSRITISEQA